MFKSLKNVQKWDTSNTKRSENSTINSLKWINQIYTCGLDATLPNVTVGVRGFCLFAMIMTYNHITQDASSIYFKFISIIFIIYVLLPADSLLPSLCRWLCNSVDYTEPDLRQTGLSVTTAFKNRCFLEEMTQYTYFWFWVQLTFNYCLICLLFLIK